MGHHHHGDHQLGSTGGRSRPSNEKLLCTAFISFQCFSIAQIVVAVIAESEALLGDSLAMMVDAFTYLFNWFAERQKALYAEKLRRQQLMVSPSSASVENIEKGSSAAEADLPTIQALQYKKYTYQLEIVPPLISVATLIVVTIFVLKESIGVLVLDAQRDRSEQSDPNVRLMMLFSCLNLLLDVVNVGCFASAKHALGYNTTPDDDDDDNEEEEEETENATIQATTCDGAEDCSCQIANGLCEIEMINRSCQPPNPGTSGLPINAENVHDRCCVATSNGNPDSCTNDDLHQSHEYEEDDDDDNEVEEMDDMDEMSPMRPRSSNRKRSDDAFGNDDNDEEAVEESNLNMCSAYTHVFADTLRSLAVIVASLLAQFTSAVTSEVADATAAVVVSALILLSLLPLFRGMVQTFRSLQKVNRQLEIERRHGGLQASEPYLDATNSSEEDESDSKTELIQMG